MKSSTTEIHIKKQIVLLFLVKHQMNDAKWLSLIYPDDRNFTKKKFKIIEINRQIADILIDHDLQREKKFDLTKNKEERINSALMQYAKIIDVTESSLKEMFYRDGCYFEMALSASKIKKFTDQEKWDRSFLGKAYNFFSCCDKKKANKNSEYDDFLFDITCLLTSVLTNNAKNIAQELLLLAIDIGHSSTVCSFMEFLKLSNIDSLLSIALAAALKTESVSLVSSIVALKPKAFIPPFFFVFAHSHLREAVLKNIPEYKPDQLSDLMRVFMNELLMNGTFSQNQHYMSGIDFVTLSAQNKVDFLYWACANKDPNICVLFLNTASEQGCYTLPMLMQRVLQLAINDKNLRVFKNILNLGADPNNLAFSILGLTPLHAVTIYDLGEFTRVLLLAGANPCAKDLEGNTPLHYAVYNCHKSIEWLIQAGAPLYAENNKGQTPFHVAALSSLEIAKTRVFIHLEKFDVMKFSISLLTFITVHSDIKFLSWFITAYKSQARQLINHSCQLGVTPLIAAVVNKNYNAVRLLLKEGANPHQLSGMRITASELAFYSQDEEIKKIFDNRLDNEKISNEPRVLSFSQKDKDNKNSKKKGKVVAEKVSNNVLTNSLVSLLKTNVPQESDEEKAMRVAHEIQQRLKKLAKISKENLVDSIPRGDQPTYLNKQYSIQEFPCLSVVRQTNNIVIMCHIRPFIDDLMDLTERKCFLDAIVAPTLTEKGSGLRRLHDMRCEVVINNECTESFPIEFELKIAHKKSRIFFYSITPDNGGSKILLPALYTKKGLHTERDKNKTVYRAKYSLPNLLKLAVDSTINIDHNSKKSSSKACLW